MHESPSVWSRVRKGRLFQVLAVYLGASWLLIQVTDALMNALSLPSWVGPVMVLLLAVGLLVVLATAWVQSRPLVDRSAAERDAVPAPWAVDVREIGRAVRHGQVPHLTWGRTLLGGVVAFSLLFGLAGAYVLVTGRAPGSAPLAASASAAPGVAVLPFDARGLDEELWSVGMVDLLTTNLDGVGGLRTIDGRTVLARWRESHAEAGGDLSAVLRVGASTGARWAVLGSAVGVGDRVRMSARLYDVETGAENGSAQVEGDPGEILTLVDALSIDLVRDLIRERQLPHVAPRSLAAITTASVPALRAYLRGEAANRRADFRGAIQAYEEALAADSTFALAAHRAGMAYGWIESRGSERTVRYRTLADTLRHRLPERDAAVMRAFVQALEEAEPAGLETLERLARTYPDDPEIWTLLGEARFHLGPMLLVPAATALEPFETAIALDSTFAPAYIHPVELTLATGRDSVLAGRLIDAYARYGAQDSDRIGSMRLAHALAYGSAAAPSLDTIPVAAIRYTPGTLSRGGTGSAVAFDRLTRLIAESPAEIFPPEGVRTWGGMFEAVLGRTGRFIEVAPDLMTWGRNEGAAVAIGEYGVSLPDALVDEVLAMDSTLDPWPLFYAGMVATHLDRARSRSTAVDLLRRRAASDTADAVFALAAADALDALDLWRRGNVGEAAAELERLRTATSAFGPAIEQLNNRLRLWLGSLEAERGRHQVALRYLSSVNFSIQARLLMAESYEALGRADSAAVAYDDVLRLWADADPDFEPALRARRGLGRLVAER